MQLRIPLFFAVAWVTLLGDLLYSQTLTIEHVLNMQRLRDIALSPDGRSVAYVVQQPKSLDDSRGPTNTEIHLANTQGGDPVQLTHNPGRDSSPQWSPDGKTLAFISDRAGQPGSQLYALNPGHDTLQTLTRHTSGIISFAWSPDGKRIAFLADQPLSEEQQERRRRGDDAIVLDGFDTDQNRPLRKLWILDCARGVIQQVDTGAHHVTKFRWSPAGERFLVVVTNDANLDYEWTRAQLAVVPTTGGKVRKYCATRGKIESLQWLPDGSGISFLGAAANGTEQAPGSLFVCREIGSVPVNLTLGKPFTVQSYRWFPNGEGVALTFVERNTRYLGTLNVSSGEISRLTARDQMVAPNISLSHDGTTIAYNCEEPQLPEDLHAGPLRGPHQKLTRLNPVLEELTYGATREFDWTARDGWDITGILITPVGYQAGDRCPTIVYVHGGPESMDLNGFNVQRHQLLAANGYAVFLPNYRGSVGRGVHYMISNHGDRGGKDFLDILDGVDALVEAGIADPDKLGIAGWSYGGFMSCWAVTQTTRFKAAMIGMGISNWYSLMGLCPVPIWNAEAHFLTWHYDNPEAYWKFSPVLNVRKVKTPTLLLYGERDPFIPPAQGREFYRGLQYYGVPSQMVVYPREGHGLGEPWHRKDASERELAWFNRYVKGVN